MVRRPDERLADVTVVLDAGVIIGLARGDHRWRNRLRAARQAGVQVVVPSAVVDLHVGGQRRWSVRREQRPNSCGGVND